MKHLLWARNAAGIGDIRNAREFWLESHSNRVFWKTENKVEILLHVLALGPGVSRYFVIFRFEPSGSAARVSVINVCTKGIRRIRTFRSKTSHM